MVTTRHPASPFGQTKSRRRKLVLALGGSLAAMALASPAYADCTPDPVPFGAIVTCTGQDPDGIVITSELATASILPNSTVDHVTATMSSPLTSGQVDLGVAGTIVNGLTISSLPVPLGPPSPFQARETVQLVVSQSGRINGANPILIQSGGPGGPIGNKAWIASLDNAGEIRTTIGNGPAIIASDVFSTGIGQLTNRSTGYIGGISANVQNIDNSGVIDGGQNSAISTRGGLFFTSGGGTLRNSGTIQNSSALATINAVGPSGVSDDLSNSGVISNAGSGAAIEASTINMRVTNAAGGQITSLGGPAISAGLNTLWVFNAGSISGNQNAVTTSTLATLTLDNTGTINGNVSGGVLNLKNAGVINGSVRALSSQVGSVITLLNGSKINGNLLLGAANDSIIINYQDSASLNSLVTGTIDGGAGINTLRYRIDAGTTDISAAVPILSSFQSPVLEFGVGANVNLIQGFTLADTLFIEGREAPPSGGAILRNKTSIVANGTAISTTYRGTSQVNLVVINEGSITANLASVNDFAVRLFAETFSNQGTITANGGGGINVGASVLNNSGTIVADRTAFLGAQFINSGVIKSNLGVGADVQGFVKNSGSILGKTEALRLGSSLTNTGLISSPSTGVLMLPGLFYGYTEIDNQVGGIISGGGRAIAVDPSGQGTGYVRVINAGTINGTVDLLIPGSANSFATTFDARSGGVVNGDLYLGNGTLVTDYGLPGRLGGVSGNIITTAGSTLQYRLSQNVTLAFASAIDSKQFSSLTWEFANAPTMRLTGPAPANPVLNVESLNGGGGTISIETDITTNSLLPVINAQNTTIDLINRGTLTITHKDPALDPTLSGPLVSFGVVNNKGTIIVRELAPATSGVLARGLSSYGPVVNDGRILVSGGVGVALDNLNYGTSSFTNNGTIAQLNGGTAGTGLINYWTATNNGTISTSKLGVLNIGQLTNNGTVTSQGAALQMGLSDGNGGGFGGGSVTNNGLLESTKGPAIIGKASAFGGSSLTNTLTGVIRSKGGGPAIIFDSNVFIENSGLIDGDVKISVKPDPLYGAFNSSYFSNGGTLKGNLIFGQGSDTFYYRSGSITGYADGGADFDVLSLDTDGKVVSGFDLRKFRNFEQFDIYGGGTFSATNAPIFALVTVSGAKLIVPSNQTLTANLAVFLYSGWLQVDGTLKTDVMTLSPGTILSGTGTLDPTAMSIQGAFVVPGGDGNVGRLTVKGSVGFDNNGGVLMIDVGKSDSDRLIVKGDAADSGALYLSNTFNAAALNLRAVGAGPRYGTNYVIATAAGGVVGQFSSVQGSIGVLTPQLIYNPNDVTLRFNASSLAAALPSGATAAEIAFAQALDTLRGSSFTSLSNVYGLIDVLEPSRLGLALNGLTPTSVGEAVSMNRVQTGMVTNLVSDRLSLLGTNQANRGALTMVGSSLRSLGGADRLVRSNASLGQMSFASRLTPGGAVIGQLPEHMSGFVSMGFDEGQSTLADGAPNERSGRHSWHMAMGLEAAVNDITTIGTAFGYTEGVSHVFGSQSNIRTSQAAAYASRQVGGQAYIAGLAAMAHSRIGLSRNTNLLDQQTQLGGTATALSFDAQAESGIRLNLTPRFKLTPRVSLRYAGSSFNTLRETGGETALRISNIRDQRLEGRVGAKLEGRVTLGHGWNLTQQIQADYVQRIAGQGGSMTVRFDAADSVAFTLPYSTGDRSWTTAKGGLQLSKDRLSLGAGFETDIGRSDYANNRAVVSLGWAF